MDVKKLFRKKEDPKEKLDEEILIMIEAMKEVDGTIEAAKYQTLCNNVKELVSIRKDLYESDKNVAGQKEDNRQKLNINTLITVGGYIASMLLILFFESDGNVITTRALQFIPKPKI